MAADEVMMSNVHRILVWLLLMSASLVVFMPTALARETSPPNTTVVLEAAMMLEAVFGTAGIGLLSPTAWRLLLISLLRVWLGGRPVGRVVGRLTTPNGVDLLTALLFASCPAPPLFP